MGAGIWVAVHSKSSLLLILLLCLFFCPLTVLLYCEQFQIKDFSTNLEILVPMFAPKLDLLYVLNLPRLLT